MVACIFRGDFPLVNENAQQGVIFGEQFPLLFVRNVSAAIADVDGGVMAITCVKHHDGSFAAQGGFATTLADDGSVRLEQG